MRDPTFAPSLFQIRNTSSIQEAAPAIATDPSPGQGFALDEPGHIPVTTQEGEWSLKITEVAVNIDSTGQQAGNVVTVSIPDLKVNDYCFVLGQTVANTRSFYVFTSGLCTTEGEIGLNYFNTDDATVNPDSKTFYFLCIHRRIVS